MRWRSWTLGGRCFGQGGVILAPLKWIIFGIWLGTTLVLVPGILQCRHSSAMAANSGRDCAGFPHVSTIDELHMLKPQACWDRCRVLHSYLNLRTTCRWRFGLLGFLEASIPEKKKKKSVYQHRSSFQKTSKNYFGDKILSTSSIIKTVFFKRPVFGLKIRQVFRRALLHPGPVAEGGLHAIGQSNGDLPVDQLSHAQLRASAEIIWLHHELHLESYIFIDIYGYIPNNFKLLGIFIYIYIYVAIYIIMYTVNDTVHTIHTHHGRFTCLRHLWG